MESERKRCVCRKLLEEIKRELKILIISQFQKLKKILKEELVVDQVFCIKSVDELQTEA